jgi:hypothetical protein
MPTIIPLFQIFLYSELNHLQPLHPRASGRNGTFLPRGQRNEMSDKLRLQGLRHGVTGQVSMTDENRSAHDAFCNPIIARLARMVPSKCNSPT